MQALQSCLSSESPRAAPERHRHHQHRPESPRCASVARLAAVLVARFTRSCGPYFVVLSEAHRPLSFPPCRPDGPAVPRIRTGQQFPESGRASGSPKPDGPAVPGSGTGRRFRAADQDCTPWRPDGLAVPRLAPDSHTPPQPIALLVARFTRSCGAHPSHDLARGVACEPSLRSGCTGDPRASARRGDSENVAPGGR